MQVSHPLPQKNMVDDMAVGGTLLGDSASSVSTSVQKDMELLVAGLVAHLPTSFKASICEQLSSGMQQHFRRRQGHDVSKSQLGQELATVATSAANVLARSGQPNMPVDANTIGMATECAITAASRAAEGGLSLTATHLSFLSAQAAALAAAERAAASGATGAEIGAAASDAAKGTHAPSQAAADAATQAAASAAAERSKSEDAVVAALKIFNLCPGEQAILGAEHVATAVARQCIRAASPLHCGLRIHIAASKVLSTCSAPVSPLARFAALKGASAVGEGVAFSGASPTQVAESVRLALQAAGADASSRLSAAKIASRASALKAASLGSPPSQVGMAAKQAADIFMRSAVLKESLAAEAAVQAIIRQKLIRGASADFLASQAREAANATGAQGSEHATLICTAAVETLTTQIARFSSPGAVGAEAKHVGISIAAALPQNMGTASSAFFSLREALYLAAKAAARAVLEQEFREGFGEADLLRKAFSQAKLALSKEVEMSGMDFAKIFGKVIVKECLRRGANTETMAELLRETSNLLQSEAQSLQSAALSDHSMILMSDITSSLAESAAEVMAETKSQLGVPPAHVHAQCKKLLHSLMLPDDVTGHIASAAARRAATRHAAEDYPLDAGTTARVADGWQPWQDKSLPAAKAAAREASKALAARSVSPGKITEAAREAVISAGLPPAAAARLAATASAEASATQAARQAASPFDVGVAAHDSVVAGLAANTSRTHALLATAVPAAVHAITQSTGRLQTAALGSRARSAAAGAMGEGDALQQA